MKTIASLDYKALLRDARAAARGSSDESLAKLLDELADDSARVPGSFVFLAAVREEMERRGLSITPKPKRGPGRPATLGKGRVPRFVNVTAEADAKLRQRCESLGVTISEGIRQALDQWLR